MSNINASSPDPAQLDGLCINAIRFLSVDAVEKANSGHPGLPMGAAPLAYVLWTRFLKHHPVNPHWFNRDRFVLSAGHGSMLLYSLLHLTGYDLPLEQIKQFRQWGSQTPGHPERGLTPGVETTTGPLGQGFANGVGLAIAEDHLAALYNRPAHRIVNHHSIALGEDGSTHQPVEQLAALRAIPQLIVIRPCDANETAVAWRVAIETRNRPCALIFTRQDVPTLDRTQFASADGLRSGAYVLADTGNGKPDLILIATGSEVSLIVAAGQKLAKNRINVRIVSMPSWELFEAQTQAYRDLVLPPLVPARLAVEAGATQGWRKYVGDGGDVIGVDRFGASAPGKVLMSEYGFTVDKICERAMKVIERQRPPSHEMTMVEAGAVGRKEGDQKWRLK